MKKLFSDIPNAPKAVGPYSPAVQAGNTIYFSGQIGIDPVTNALAGASVEEQSAQVFKNIDTLLAHTNSKKTDIVKTTIFLTDLSVFKLVNGLYETWLAGHKPARSTVQVSALPLGSCIEIECVISV